MSFWRDARSGFAARPGGLYMRLRVLQAYVDQDGGHPPRFCRKQLPFSKKCRIRESPPPLLPPLSSSEQMSLHQRRAVATRSSQKLIPMSIRISELCRTLHSPLHCWLISILLSRNRLRSLPGEAHVRNFYFCKFLTVLVVSYLFSFFISIFCFSDFRKILRLSRSRGRTA